MPTMGIAYKGPMILEVNCLNMLVSQRTFIYFGFHLGRLRPGSSIQKAS